MDFIAQAFTFLGAAAIIQGFFLAFLLFRHQQGNRRANTILAVFLLLFSLSLIHSLSNIEDLNRSSSFPVKVREPFQLLVGPLIYFYVQALTNSKFRFKKRDLFHFLPFFLLIGATIPLTLHPVLAAQAPLINILFWVIILVHLCIYIVLIRNETKKHEKRIKNNFSSIEKINLNWIKLFTRALIVVYGLFLALLAMLVHAANPFPHFNQLVAIILAITIYGLGYKGLTQPQVFTQMLAEESPIQNGKNNRSSEREKEGTGKYRRSGLTDEEAADILKRLTRHMEEEKPYLNTELALPALARQLQVNRNHLSQVINERLNLNFYDFVSQYRVKEVKRLMADPENNNYTLLALAYEAGFNSKPAFNKIFKIQTGMTPSQYKKNRS